MKKMHSKEFFERLVHNELHELPEVIQEETIEKLTKYNNLSFTTEKVRKILMKIKYKYLEACVTPGDSVGVIAAQSMGESSTQMILRTFHYAGVGFKHVIGGLQRVKEIIDATYNIKEPVMEIIVNGKRKPELVLDDIQKIKKIKSAKLSHENGRILIYTQGSNLKEVLAIKGVDEQKTTTNDIREIEHVLGIEAARQSIIDQLYDIYESEGLDIDLRHIILVADMMTVNGTVENLGRVGIMKHKTSIISRMGYEGTVPILYEAGWLGKEDKLEGITENIIAGKVINIGTGKSEIVLGLK